MNMLLIIAVWLLAATLLCMLIIGGSVNEPEN
jgi:hypothetical protein